MKLLTTADLAERWTCEESTVLEHVRVDGLKFVAIGRSPKGPSVPGQKNYRFRLVDVEDWEANRAMSWARVEPKPLEPIVVVPPKAIPKPVSGWDGVFRGPAKPRKRRASQ